MDAGAMNRPRRSGKPRALWASPPLRCVPVILAAGGPPQASGGAGLNLDRGVRVSWQVRTVADAECWLQIFLGVSAKCRG